MPKPQIVWCAQSALHYVTESSTRYGMPLYLAIQLKQHLRDCMKKNNDCVARWISNLSPADRIQIQVIEQQSC